MNPTRSLAAKLVLAFWLVSMLSIGIIAVLAGVFAERQLGNFARAEAASQLAADLTEYFAERRTWEGLPTAQGFGRRRHMGGLATEPPFILFGPNGEVVWSSRPGIHSVGLPGPTTTLRLEIADEHIGTLDVASPGFPPDTFQAGILAQLRRDLVLAALAATGGSLLIGVLIARRLTTPIREVSEASQAVGRGDLSARVPVRSADELGDLAASFNRMQAQLSELEELRRNMTADIAHELRTPLGVLLGTAEALRDGILPATPDRLDAIYEQARRLSRLVEDLRTLSLGEAGELSLQPQPIRLSALLEQTARRHEAGALSEGVSLELDRPDPDTELVVDPDRMNQVLDILVLNAIRHASRPGAVRVRSSIDAGQVRIHVDDDGPGIPDSERSNLFQRYYRSGSGRKSEPSGSGLGLVIARSLVRAHSGTISASSKPGRGARFTVTLPAPGTDRKARPDT